MFSILNNKSDVAFLFSSERKNNNGIELATKILSKRDLNSYENNLESMVRGSIFPVIPRRQIEKFSLKLYKKMYKLSKKDMRNYKVEITEEWQFLGSDFDLIEIHIHKIRENVEKMGKNEYLGHPTYFPFYIRNVV